MTYDEIYDIVYRNRNYKSCIVCGVKGSDGANWNYACKDGCWELMKKLSGQMEVPYSAESLAKAAYVMREDPDLLYSL